MTANNNLDNMLAELRHDLNESLSHDFPNARLSHQPHQTKPLDAIRHIAERLDAHLDDLAALVESLTGTLPRPDEPQPPNATLALAPQLLSYAERMGRKLQAAESLLDHVRERL